MPCRCAMDRIWWHCNVYWQNCQIWICVKSLLQKKGGGVNSPDKLQFWQIAQSLPTHYWIIRYRIRKRQNGKFSNCQNVKMSRRQIVEEEMGKFSMPSGRFLTWIAHIRDLTRSYARYNSFICETWLVHMWDMTRSYVRRDSFICEPWLVHTWDMTRPYVRHVSLIRETWLTHMQDMTRSYVRHDAHTWDMTRSYVRHDSFICATWLAHMWDKTHS